MAFGLSNKRLHPSLTLSTEQRLLLLLARGRLTDSVRAQARSLLGQALSWPLLLQQARVYEVTPFLYHHLRQLGFPSVPDAAAAELEAAYRMNAIRNTLLVRELAAVMHRLGAAGVPVMPLKGVALAASLYGDPTLRVCADLDILVPRAEVGQAYQLLQVMGYDGASGEFMEESFQRRLLKTSIEYALTRRDRGFRYAAELHWGIFLGAPSERVALETLWAGACATSIFGVMAFQPSAEWTFLCLAVHAARHLWRGLKWLGDIHELCTWTVIDWAKVRCEAERVGWERVVELTLSACHTLYGTKIPPHFSFRPLPPWVHLFPADLLYAEPWRDVLAISRLFTSPPAQWRYLLRVLLVPTAAERRLIRLPSALGILYYPLRFSRVAIRHGWRLMVGHRRPLTRDRLHS
ncbi:MAG TPA: nucleotidyltransferase family protein [Candidatus Tectomicrobia bacterium]|nr:nucleotidyltransferase family protein [Candidatus Tectomicrobia bacterium]